MHFRVERRKHVGQLGAQNTRYSSSLWEMRLASSSTTGALKHLERPTFIAASGLILFAA
jgi:hypothetical protein